MATFAGPKTKRPDLIGFAISNLLDFFGDSTASAITRATCTAYVDWRTTQQSPKRTAIKSSTARRELVVLSAALRWCWKEGKIDRPIPLTLPPQADPRERHLSRSEVAALLAGALGWDRNGVRHRSRINRHLARFILLALYTGTRHDAILRLQWAPNTGGGWIDLDAGVIYRKAVAAVDSIKRRPPIPIPPLA
jgi:integrase